MAEQQQSIKVVIDRLLRHPLLQDLTLETIVDYSIDFMRIVGVPSMFTEKVTTTEIKDYRALLPCDYYQINQIRGFNQESTAAYTFRYATDTFHMSELKSGAADYTYKIQGGVIFTNVKEATIEISYQAISMDGDGYPMIPDNSSFTRALEGYVKKQQFTILFDMGKISHQVLHQALQDYAWAVGDCQSEFNRMSLDKAESFYNSWRTLLIRPSEHRSGFVNNGSPERLKI